MAPAICATSQKSGGFSDYGSEESKIGVKLILTRFSVKIIAEDMQAMNSPFTLQAMLVKALAVMAALMLLYGTTAEAATSEHHATQSVVDQSGPHLGDNTASGHHHHDGEDGSEKGDQHGLCAQSHCHHNAFSGSGASFHFKHSAMSKLYFELNGNMPPSALIHGLKRPPRI